MLSYWYNYYRYCGDIDTSHSIHLLLPQYTLMKGNDYAVQNEVLEDIYKQFTFSNWFDFIRWLNIQNRNGFKPIFRLDDIQRSKVKTSIIITVRKESLL